MGICSEIICLPVMSSKKIIGIVLVKNEDIFINRVLKNIAEFCDDIFVADNCSIDRTTEKIKEEQCRNQKIIYYAVTSPALSHELLTSYAGTNTWIFAVDGDELYDPAGLQQLRSDILLGKYDAWWMILGNVLHCVELNIEHKYARGYLAPPCRSMTKLYNFSAIDAWRGPCPERLHGGTICFRNKYDKSLRLDLHQQHSWEESLFRCLHLCFIKRSSLDKAQENQLVIRQNISDISSRGLIDRVKYYFLKIIKIRQDSSWKTERYMRGSLVEKSVATFLR